MIKMTGVGIEVAYTVEMWSLGIPFVAVFICMCVTILLGCGMPIPAAYALVAIVVAPVLVRLGLPALQVHLFIFYFAAFSTLSPPVASAPLMASSISGGSYFKTAVESMRVAAPAFIIRSTVPLCSNFLPLLTTFGPAQPLLKARMSTSGASNCRTIALLTC